LSESSPRKQLHASSHSAIQPAVAAPAPAPAPAEDFDEQTEEESNQCRAAISF